MSEATEFLVFCSALRQTPGRLEALVEQVGAERARPVLERMAGNEATAAAQLEALLSGRSALPDHVPMDRQGNPLEVFLAARSHLLRLLDEVNGERLHSEGKLPSGRILDPWRLAGNLADHDVRHLAELGRLLHLSSDQRGA